MKTALNFCLLSLITFTMSACLYTPDTTYTYWRYSPETQMYSTFKTEVPLTPEELKALQLVEKLPDDAKLID